MSFDRKAARARCEAATPGWWELVRHDNPGGEINWQVWVHGDAGDGHGFNTSDLGTKCNVRKDAEFVTHARLDLPAALDLLDRCEEALSVKWCPECRVKSGGTYHAEGCINGLLLADMGRQIVWEEP